jgi:hypothetical protein
MNWKKRNPEKVRAAGKTEKAKLNLRMRSGIWGSLNGSGNKNGRSWESLVGYDIEKLRKHLEKQFTSGMSWKKFFLGEIHIDHKIPISAFNFSSPKDIDFKRCWALTNLQPLWKEDNLKKHAHLLSPFQPSLEVAI